MPRVSTGLRALAEAEARKRRIQRDALDLVPVIAPETTFLEYCLELQAAGLKVDEHSFTLDDRPALRWVYSRIPTTREAAFKAILILMKSAQVGFTVMEILAGIYFGLKWMPCKIGFYLPGQELARIKSSERFMPIIRTIPAAYQRLVESSGTTEGNIMIRNMGRSRFHFMWTTSRTATESIPLDVLLFDEVQEMTVSDMEKTSERMSGSMIRYTCMGSTANMPDSDIEYFYKRGTQYQYHTCCEHCDAEHILDEEFPDCIRHNGEGYEYWCKACGGTIADTQRHHPKKEHGWMAKNPHAERESIHFPQTISPTISAEDLILSYFNAEDIKNFYNRKLGKSFIDKDKLPISDELLNECVADGIRLGVTWKLEVAEGYMGVDQMGAFNCVLIAERLPTGHMAIVHAEAIYSDDPFARCDELMESYNVVVCVVEQLPNFNDARRFASRHIGRVFLVNRYSREETDNWVMWGDALPSYGERKTVEDERMRYTVVLSQYRAMDSAFGKIKKRICVFPDPNGLVQDIKEKEMVKPKPILKDVVFEHFKKTALIVDMHPEEKRMRARVVKVGIDPHFSYAFMMLNAAWVRSHGTSSFIIPGVTTLGVREDMPGLPPQVVEAIEEVNEDTCGVCTAYKGGLCKERMILVKASDVACPLFIEKE